jgi:hypothetical protein
MRYCERSHYLLESWQAKDFLSSRASNPALGPNQPPIQWVQRAISPGVKRPGLEADHSPPSSAELGSAIAQAVSHWLPTAAVLVRARFWKVGFVVNKVALGQVFSEYFGFPCQSSFH